MGLQKTNYVVPTYGVTITNAYARIYSMSIDVQGNARAYIAVCAARGDIGTKIPFEVKEVEFTTDKLSNPYEQAYTVAKQGYFEGWQDDIPEQD